jgi:hypothetical protein
MKRFPASAALASLAIAAGMFLAAEALGAPVASSYENQAGATSQAVEQYTFRVIILGTRRGPDIEVIRKNVEKLAYVSLFVPSLVSQKHIEFEGMSTGDKETLIADIESLSQDRYEVKSKDDRRRGLVITLRKIPPISTTAEE